ncbi:hypothetical protein O166_18645 [Pseudogulbenkiania ferrooxidans EGD-HP2]|uniref:Helix-turn-helix domain-containing protein n=1 Tax=Pseudogulbenkiania ferrooxidans EGD-HP2 TaxID=1388764 RepID=A0ABP2XSE8_9NEIS|nr:hypothetical protein O166_18645 [Pseudogulbenkiania ferrooxidans EGD-HP2]
MMFWLKTGCPDAPASPHSTGSPAMELSVYIHCIGDEAAARQFGVALRTASSWRRMERAPSPQQALKIVELSLGQVDWKGIYAPYARHRLRRAGKLTLPPARELRG